MAPEQMLAVLSTGMAILLLIIAFMALSLKKCNAYYYGKMDKAAERSYLHQLRDNDIPVNKTLDNIKRVNSFIKDQSKDCYSQ